MKQKLLLPTCSLSEAKKCSCHKYSMKNNISRFFSFVFLIVCTTVPCNPDQVVTPHQNRLSWFMHPNTPTPVTQYGSVLGKFRLALDILQHKFRPLSTIDMKTIDNIFYLAFDMMIHGDSFSFYAV